LKQLFALKYDNTNLSKWIIQYLLNCNTQTLQGGITFTELYEFIKINHTNQLEISDKSIKAILNYLVAFQFEKNIKPIIIDYDNGADKLNIVDREFIIWLSFKDKNELLSLIQN
ncbi:MAG: hypothetical protein ABL872_17560, partial [Lacibacter sp.]